MNNVYQMVTDRIIETLNSGIIPWQRPWNGGIDGAVSYATGKPYSFLNQLLLGRDGEWLTFQQVKNACGSIKKGAKAGIVCFYKQHVIKKEVINADGEKEEKTSTVPVLKYYHVFHIEDTTVESKIKEVKGGAEANEDAEAIVNTYVERDNLKLEIKVTNKAYYSPTKDMVSVPAIEQYESTDEYYSTLFHELIHSTGHKKRLNRNLEERGKENYSREELVAEMGSAMLCKTAGLEDEKCFRNSVGYIQGWAKCLENDPKAVVWAASRAEKAADYILGRQDEE